MPSISSFYGIKIYIYYDDHLPAHFHAIYGEFEVLIDINTLEIIKGNLPARAIAFIKEWAKKHQKELLLNWDNAINKRALQKVQPLE
jgi:hypothetical protein